LPWASRSCRQTGSDRARRLQRPVLPGRVGPPGRGEPHPGEGSYVNESIQPSSRSARRGTGTSWAAISKGARSVRPRILSGGKGSLRRTLDARGARAGQRGNRRRRPRAVSPTPVQTNPAEAKAAPSPARRSFWRQPLPLFGLGLAAGGPCFSVSGPLPDGGTASPIRAAQAGSLRFQAHHREPRLGPVGGRKCGASGGRGHCDLGAR